MKLAASLLFISLVDGRSRFTEVVESSWSTYGKPHPEKLHLEKLIQPWNVTQGPPPRGWYNLKFEVEYGLNSNDMIKKSGQSGETKSTFDFTKLKEAHYCRYRNVDGEQCCDREDQNCYTQAGCFCDEACYTTYGDCCQDHWVTCYDDLKLCLNKAVDSDKPDAKNANIDGGTYGMKGSKRSKSDMLLDVSEISHPSHVAPNACCGTDSFNNQIDCCKEDGASKYIKRGSPCIEPEEDEEEEEDGGIDERLQSPEPYEFMEEEEDF